ncbi:MAG: tRNA (adenosine(37)-N6)-dimethylallyltransferase MiaA [Treponema sp.]|nr:tRNA (adenosine(37)-N6)-dimethylallyltransferase MiaA [Treponema sp.]
MPALILFGPTASGKTELLERLFAGPRPLCRAEIVSADSVQVYRGMDIGAAKPQAAVLAALPHHLIDICNPDEQFNVGDFVRLADQACAGISARGALPVISGGAGFYLRNFVLGLPEAPPSDPLIRKTLEAEFRERGAQALMEELAACDPVSAGRIHLNDAYRLRRALEVFRASGRPLSSFASTGAAPESRPRYRFLILGLERPREEAYRRIDERCALMFRQGLPEEVRRLHEAGYGPGNPGMRAIGYREFFVEEAPGQWGIDSDLDKIRDLVARNSRRYAKRQIAFFASIPNVTWIPARDDPAGEIRRRLAL